MPDTSKVLEALRAARARVDEPGKWWTPGRLALGLCDDASCCAMTSFGDFMDDPADYAAAWRLVRAAGLSDVYELPAWNDSHTHEEVLAAYDLAIATLVIESATETPQADAGIEVMQACDVAADVLARYIVSEYPGMDLAEIQILTRTELFLAAQDTARVCGLSTRAES